MYNEQGEKTWDCTLDVYGKVATFEGSSLKECPFRYQGQYEDGETGLYYNRFRYYEPEIGGYLSQDPIGLLSGKAVFYSYVIDTNIFFDVWGLIEEGEIGIFSETKNTGNQIGNGVQRNHLNQTALFNLDRDAGAVMGLKGSAFKNGTQHNIFHSHMDDFYGSCKNGMTSVFKYNIELFKGLKKSGMSMTTSLKGVIAAQMEQFKNGIKPWDRIKVGNVKRTTHH